MKPLLILCVVLALTGCAGLKTLGLQRIPPPSGPAPCLAMNSYSQAYQDSWAAELAKLPPNNVLNFVSGDYITLRDENRAACGVKVAVPAPAAK